MGRGRLFDPIKFADIDILQPINFADIDILRPIKFADIDIFFPRSVVVSMNISNFAVL